MKTTIRQQANDAMAKGEDTFVPIKPCRNGHLLRRTSTGGCVACGKANYITKYKLNNSKYSHETYMKNRLAIIRRSSEYQKKNLHKIRERYQIKKAERLKNESKTDG